MSQKISSSSRRMIAWICAVVIILLLGAFWFFSDRNPLSPKTVDQKPQKTVFRKKIAKRPNINDRSTAPKTEFLKTPPTSPRPAAAEQIPKVQTVKPAPAEPAKTIEAVKTRPRPTPEVKPPPGVPQIAKTEPKSTPAETAPLPSIRADQAQKEAPSQRVSQPAPKPKQLEPTPAAARSETHEVRREKWILAQDGASYTIQVIGVSSEKSMLDFIKRNHLLQKNEIAYYETIFRGKPWFQALYGLFPSGREARSAADKLPEGIRRSGPWIRKLSDVQKAIGN